MRSSTQASTQVSDSDIQILLEEVRLWAISNSYFDKLVLTLISNNLQGVSFDINSFFNLYNL